MFKWLKRALKKCYSQSVHSKIYLSNNFFYICTKIFVNFFLIHFLQLLLVSAWYFLKKWFSFPEHKEISQLKYSDPAHDKIDTKNEMSGKHVAQLYILYTPIRNMTWLSCLTNSVFVLPLLSRREWIPGSHSQYTSLIHSFTKNCFILISETLDPKPLPGTHPDWERF